VFKSPKTHEREEHVPRRAPTGFDLRDEWNLSTYIASQQWDLVSAPQASDTSIASNGSTDEWQGTNPIPSSSHHDSGPCVGHEQPAASILSVLDSLKCGAFLLDLQGRVLSLNVIALGRLGDGLALGGERLSATDRATDHRLQAMVSCAVAGGERPNTPMSVAVRRRSRPPLVIRAVRLDEGAQPTPGTASVLLLAVDPELRREPPREVLAQAFGLTAAEAEVAVGIASGKTLAEIAAERGVKIGTVRVYSKAVFSKTHTRGQAELTGLLTRFAFLACGEGKLSNHNAEA
jgi:DNA-binding CsgD family transcriptional regulator